MISKKIIEDNIIAINIGVLIISAVYFLFFFTPDIRNKYSLVVTTLPVNANVRIVEAGIDYSPGTEYSPGTKLLPGQYTILVTMYGFKKKRLTVQIIDKMVETGVVKLEKLGGSPKGKTPRIKLRSKPNTAIARTGFRLKDIENDYVDNGDGTISDRATGLMWQRRPSGHMQAYRSWEHVKKLNQKKFAGYKDWRLPTVEELWSLMENEQINRDLYIHPVFDRNRRGVQHYWSADQPNWSNIWFVRFDSRSVESERIDFNFFSAKPVRAVRTIKEP